MQRFSDYNGLAPDSKISANVGHEGDGGARVLVIEEHGGRHRAAVVLDSATAQALADDLDTEGATPPPNLTHTHVVPAHAPAYRRNGNIELLACTTFNPADDAAHHVVSSRRHLTLGYTAHKIRVPGTGEQVTVYVNSDGTISVDVGLNTAVKLRHGRQPQRLYNARTAALLEGVADIGQDGRTALEGEVAEP